MRELVNYGHNEADVQLNRRQDPIMNNLTAAQVKTIGEKLEYEAATTLGRMIFEFSRLDMNLGLFLVWSDEGSKLDKLTKEVECCSFHQKLNFLKKLIDGKFVEHSNEYFTYSQWLDAAHAIRDKRNKLIHGRWGIDPYKQMVVNVVGLPTSPKQYENYYSIENLEDVLSDVKSLSTQLHKGRKKWPM